MSDVPDNVYLSPTVLGRQDVKRQRFLLEVSVQLIATATTTLNRVRDQSMAVKVAFGRTLFHADALRDGVTYERAVLMSARRSELILSSWSNVCDYGGPCQHFGVCWRIYVRLSQGESVIVTTVAVMAVVVIMTIMTMVLARTAWLQPRLERRRNCQCTSSFGVDARAT